MLPTTFAIQYLQREHDNRVEEYRKLRAMLPSGMEIAAMRLAVEALRKSGKPLVARILTTYMDRLKEAAP
jgi:hypothetical protein